MITTDLVEGADRQAQAPEASSRPLQGVIAKAWSGLWPFAVLAVMVAVIWQITVPTSTWFMRPQERETAALAQDQIPVRLADLGLEKVTRIHRTLVGSLTDGGEVAIQVDEWRKSPTTGDCRMFPAMCQYKYRISNDAGFSFRGEPAPSEWAKSVFVGKVRADIDALAPEILKAKDAALRVKKAQDSWTESSKVSN